MCRGINFPPASGNIFQFQNGTYEYWGRSRVLFQECFEEITKTLVNASLIAWLKAVSQAGLGALLFCVGISHLTVNRLEFQAQVPPWLPVDPDVAVVISGVAEMFLGVALLTLWKFRARVGMVTALFFVAIFPGNISQFQNGTDAFGLNTDEARAIRLLFQPIFVLLALWSTNAWRRS